jgi:DNA-binding NarL/FixJ family response regulator
MQVILADNQEIYRAGMAGVLTAKAMVEVVAQCREVQALLEAMRRNERSIVIFPSSFVDQVHELLDHVQRAGSRGVMVLEPEMPLEAGVARRLHGVLTRSVGEPQLMNCLYSVAAGDRYMQKSVVTAMSAPDRAGLKAVQRLTARELQIVALVCEGKKNKEIADALGTKEQVIKNYLRGIYVKTGVSDRLELALFTVHHQAMADVVEGARRAMVRTA